MFIFHKISANGWRYGKCGNKLLLNCLPAQTYIIILNSYTHRIKIGGRSLIFVPALLGLRTRGPIRGKRSAASTTNLILFLQSRLHLWWFWPRSQTDLCFNFLTHTHQSPELAEEIIPQDVFVQKDCLGFIEEMYIKISKVSTYTQTRICYSVCWAQVFYLSDFWYSSSHSESGIILSE